MDDLKAEEHPQLVRGGTSTSISYTRDDCKPRPTQEATIWLATTWKGSERSGISRKEGRNFLGRGDDLEGKQRRGREATICKGKKREGTTT